MDVTAYPHIGIDTVALGLKRKEIIELLGSGYTVFKRFTDDPDTLAFDSIGCQLDLDESDRLAKIIVFRPNRLFLGAIQLLDRALDELTVELKTNQHDFETVDAGLWSPALAILCIEHDGKTDGVEIGR